MSFAVTQILSIAAALAIADLTQEHFKFNPIVDLIKLIM